VGRPDPTSTPPDPASTPLPELEGEERCRREAGYGLHAAARVEGGGAPPWGEGHHRRSPAPPALPAPPPPHPLPDPAVRARRSPDPSSPPLDPASPQSDPASSPASPEGEREGRGPLRRRGGGACPPKEEEAAARARRRRRRQPHCVSSAICDV